MEKSLKLERLKISVIFSYVLAYLYVRGFVITQTESYAMYQVLFVGTFILWSECLAFGERRNREDFLWLGSVIIAGTSFLWRNDGIFWGQTGDGFVHWFAGLMLHVFAIFYVLSRFRYLIGYKSSGYFFLDLLQGMIVIPFSQIFLRTKVLFTRTKKENEEEKTNPLAVIGVVIGTIIFLAIALNLLSASDDKFADVISGLFVFEKFNLTVFVSVVISIPVGAYLFGLVGGCCSAQAKRVQGEKIGEIMEKIRTVKNSLFVYAMSLFCVIYALYIYIQMEYLFGAIMGRLPMEFTFAEYARQGFFELCMITGLNLSIILIVQKFSATPFRENKALKIIASIFMVESLLFAVTALSKLVFYINAYGFTALRLLSSWWVLVLSFAVVLVLLNIWKKINAVDKLIYMGVISFLVICLV